MSGQAGFAYAQARLQARHGMRPGEAVWAALKASRDAGHYIETARRTALRPFVHHLTPHMGVHAVERSLRADWRAYVEEVASWHPQAWRPTVTWMAILPLLPLLAHLTGGRPAADWMRADPVLAFFMADDHEARRDALEQEGYQCFAPVFEGEGTAGDCWLSHWRGLWSKEKARRRPLDALIETLRRKTGGHAPDQLLVSRPVMAAEFLRAFRRYPQSPAAGVAHLGLVAMDLERLRGDLVRRTLLPDTATGEVRAWR